MGSEILLLWLWGVNPHPRLRIEAAGEVSGSGRVGGMLTDYSAAATCFIVPLGPGLCLAHRSSSVIGTGMQKPPPVLQLPHGELVELSVIGGQEVLAADTVVCDSKSLTATA